MGPDKATSLNAFLWSRSSTALISLVLAIVLNSRGARPVEQRYRQRADHGFTCKLGDDRIRCPAGPLLCASGRQGYPAFVLSVFKPVLVLRGQVSSLASKSVMRRTLVVLQFAVSLMLIVGTLVIRQQLNFLKTRPLGFDKEAVAVIQMDTGNDPSTWESFKQTLLSQSAIASASFASGVPGQTGELRLFVPEGRDTTETSAMVLARVDQDYVDTYGVKMAEGRFYSREFPSDTSDAFVINQAAERSLRLDGRCGRERS